MGNGSSGQRDGRRGTGATSEPDLTGQPIPTLTLPLKGRELLPAERAQVVRNRRIMAELVSIHVVRSIDNSLPFKGRARVRMGGAF